MNEILTEHELSREVDKQTECAELFFSYIEENLPDFRTESDEIKALFYEIKAKLAAVYSSLPTSCFQADLNDSNILLDESDYDTFAEYEAADRPRMALFMQNLANFAENYEFTPTERTIFPEIVRYMDSIRWGDVRKIERIRDNRTKLGAYLSWIKHTMTRTAELPKTEDLK